MNKVKSVADERRGILGLVQSRVSKKSFLEGISEDGDRIVFQLHSDPEFVFRSMSLGGCRPHIHQILDSMAGNIGRDLKYVYDYEGHRYKIGFADYVK